MIIDDIIIQCWDFAMQSDRLLGGLFRLMVDISYICINKTYA